MPYFAIFTTLGLQRLAEAQASGVPLVFTELAVGDGNGSEITPLASMTALVNEVERVDVNLIEIHPDAPSTVRVEGLIPAATGGFTIREAGLFNDDGELIAIASYPPIYKPVPADGVSVDEYIRILLVYAETTAIELTADLSVVVATRRYADFRDDELEARIDILEAIEPGFFGDGSDGDAVADGVSAVPGMTLGGSIYSMTRDCHFQTLIVDTGAQVETNGFRLFCSVKLEVTEYGIGVTANGNDGEAGAGGVPGAAGAATATGTVLGGATGGAGGGTPGSNGASVTNSLGGTGGGAGGAGGNVGAGLGGSGGTNTALTAALGSPHSSPAYPGHVVGISAGASAWTAIKGGAGGGGGGRGNTGVDGGGGGGSGGGVLVVCARELDLAAEENLQCLGGAGGDGDDPDGGAGGGGQGGVAVVVYEKCNQTLTESVICEGGAAGDGGSGLGNDGQAGGVGSLVQFALGEGSTPTVGHRESGFFTVSAYGEGTEYEVEFISSFAAATGENGYDFDVNISYAEDPYEDLVHWRVVEKTVTGFVIKLTDDNFIGEIRWWARSRITTP